MNILQQQQQQNQSKPPSWEAISKHFSLPLSDAANNLGVCVSVLKKICRENGLDRWPYRKYLAGKSIEDIRRYAAREKLKALSDLAKAANKRFSLCVCIQNWFLDVHAYSLSLLLGLIRSVEVDFSSYGQECLLVAVFLSLAYFHDLISGIQQQNNENSKPHKLQQQGTKDVPVGRQHITLTPGLAKGLMGLDEFKYGFPSDGLSTATNKWWGSNLSDTQRASDRVGIETDEDDSHQSDEKTDAGTRVMMVDYENAENGKTESNEIDPQGTGLLTSVRKRAVEEGREALKLGVHRTYGVNKIGRKQRALLLRIFGSSLPKQWIQDFCSNRVEL
ncbi:hypothetical protein SADUNF_Sadunf02G0049400 [Salix dunnii]|uniref:RWP-RK domain-containing protein n=1 Tax=Salix dunnii TaxID=1413687 RepID=A0A835N6D8_9ROSI|nr:hypothetical protein SADUNF_Sadunf02G0049400 [Salix dunnii]